MTKLFAYYFLSPILIGRHPHPSLEGAVEMGDVIDVLNIAILIHIFRIKNPLMWRIGHYQCGFATAKGRTDRVNEAFTRTPSRRFLLRTLRLRHRLCLRRQMGEDEMASGRCWAISLIRCISRIIR